MTNWEFPVRNYLFTVMIRIDDLTIGYAAKGGAKVVASGLCASLRGGEMTCLIGANGVGKSTLLRTLSGFQAPLSGHVYIDGRPMGDFSVSELSRVVGVVLTGRPETGNLTVEELVALGRNPYTGFWGTLTEADRRIVEESMELTGIAGLARRMVYSLSDGERQKMMIAKALAQQTEVVFLDEPTAFLDYPSKVEMMQLLHRLAVDTGKVIFMSTHDLELTLRIADRLWLMSGGGELHVGTPRELADAGLLARFVDRGGVRFDAATLSVTVE